MLSRTLRLNGRSCERFFRIRSKHRIRTPYGTFLCVRSRTPGWAVVVRKKDVPLATRRNRIRRVCYAALDHLGGRALSVHQVVWLYNATPLGHTASEIAEHLRPLLAPSLSLSSSP